MKTLLFFFAVCSLSLAACQPRSHSRKITQAWCVKTTTEATCTGSASCNACKNCKYCKYCSQQGNKCGVCK
jgi:hypothetical protein